MRYMPGSLAGAILFGWAAVAAAQGTITDGDAIFSRNVFGAAPGASFRGVSANLGQNHLFELGWWFRLPAGTAESAFGAPSSQLYVGNTSTITWNSLGAGAFSAQEVTVVTDTGLGGVARMVLTITNLSLTTPLTIDLFQMADVDLNGPLNDSGNLLVSPNHVGIRDPSNDFAEYRGVHARRFLVRPFGVTSVGTVLNDAAVTTFTNLLLPFVVGNITVGFQWTATIPAGGSRSFTALLAVNQSVAEDVDGDGKPDIITGAGAGGGPHVKLFSGLDGSEIASFFAYNPAFTGGVRVALCDLTGDGFADLVVAPGPGGGPHVKVFDGVTRALLSGTIGSFFAYNPAFVGGLFVACGDVDGNGTPDIVTGAGAGGGPHVRVFSGLDGSELSGFFAYDPAFTGGVSVAAGDVNGDSRADIITGAGAGGSPHVRVFSLHGAEFAGFFAYDPTFTGGVSVAAGHVNGDFRAEIITGAGAGGGPHVRVFSLFGLTQFASFFAYNPAFTGGVSVAAGDVNGDFRAEIITGAGAGGGPHVRVLYSDGSELELGGFFAYNRAFTGGVFVGR